MKEKWGILMAVILLFNLPVNGHTASTLYNFIPIADNSGSFDLLFPPSINNNGTVAFLATLRSGGESILKGSGGPLTTIADTNGPFSDFGRGTSINDAGRVAFRGDSGVFTGDGGPLTTVALSGGPLSHFGEHPAINNAGTVAFERMVESSLAVVGRLPPSHPPAGALKPTYP